MQTARFISSFPFSLFPKAESRINLGNLWLSIRCRIVLLGCHRSTLAIPRVAIYSNSKNAPVRSKISCAIPLPVVARAAVDLGVRLTGRKRAHLGVWSSYLRGTGVCTFTGPEKANSVRLRWCSKMVVGARQQDQDFVQRPHRS